jgi:hypothetical protein
VVKACYLISAQNYEAEFGHLKEVEAMVVRLVDIEKMAANANFEV